MKNLLKLIGIITIISVIGFTMAACAEDPAEEETAKMTITGFDFAQNGYFVEANASKDDFVYYIAAKNYDSSTDTLELAEVKNRFVTLSVWEHAGDTPAIYKGSDTLTFTVYIYDVLPAAVTDLPILEGTVDVAFKKGVGIVDIALIQPIP